LSCSPMSAAQGCLPFFNEHASALCRFQVCRIVMLVC
jgi:hypothetical protein